MTIDFVFLLNSILLGVGLAMDAFSVSLAFLRENRGEIHILTSSLASNYIHLKYLVDGDGYEHD